MTIENQQSIVQINLALAAALGITNVERLTRIELVIQPGRLPAVRAEYQLLAADGLHAAMDQLSLVPTQQETRDAA